MTSQPTEARYASNVERVYANDSIEVTWEPGLCIHFAACIRGSSKAFNPRNRPWVDVNAETPERIAEIVSRCPTGALHAIWKDGHPSETPPEPATIIPTTDGPLFLHGKIRILDRQGNVVRADTRIALCRCGHSKNKPFCDDSHYEAGFVSDDERFGPDPDNPDDLVT
jgi:uncharacterized Fe-S cluster protein YjdI/CDGSH-type Zn-finger protein